MARPPLPLGTPGSIKVTETKPKVWVARCRFRDHDGHSDRDDWESSHDHQHHDRGDDGHAGLDFHH